MLLDLMLYYSIVIVPTYILYKNRNCIRGRLRYRFSFFLACILPSFFYGIRHGVGRDWALYYSYYQKWLLGYSWRDTILEPGYFLLSILCKLLGINFYGFSFICCCLLEISILKALENFRLQKTLWMGYFLAAFTLYFVAYNITRQMIATSFLILAYTYYKNGDRWKAVLLFIVAISFHKTAILGIVIVAVCKVYKDFSLLGKFKTLIFSLFLSCASFVILRPLITYIQQLGFYTSGEYAGHSFRVEELRFLAYYIPEWMLLYLSIKRKGDIRLYECYAIFMLGCLFQFMACYYPYVDRLSWYFVGFRILLYPLILLELTGRLRRQFCLFSIAWFLIYFFVMFYIFPSNGLFPYKTLFQQ